MSKQNIQMHEKSKVYVDSSVPILACLEKKLFAPLNKKSLGCRGEHNPV